MKIDERQARSRHEDEFDDRAAPSAVGSLPATPRAERSPARDHGACFGQRGRPARRWSAGGRAAGDTAATGRWQCTVRDGQPGRGVARLVRRAGDVRSASSASDRRRSARRARCQPPGRRPARRRSAPRRPPTRRDDVARVEVHRHLQHARTAAATSSTEHEHELDDRRAAVVGAARRRARPRLLAAADRVDRAGDRALDLRLEDRPGSRRPGSRSSR